ncbi:MAG: carbamoyl-phosphate synthase large subunit [Candidatus Dormibacteria bacterium]
MCRSHRAGRWTAPGRVPGLAPALQPRTVLVIGSGPILIGQAAEFDYAGTQACRALREEGVRTVLVNSNPATIMTDAEVADAVYIEPLTVEVLRRVIERERPDALLSNLGGQTALNLTMELAAAGVLEEFGVRVLGSDIDTIRRAEDREAFKELLRDLGEPVPDSTVVSDVDTAVRFGADTGYPLVVRPGYTLGGTGGGIAHDREELERICAQGLLMSPIRQVLIERYLGGWKELEYEVMRDRNDTCITVCNMENLDPMGVHTGDSIVSAPSQTLSDREHQMLRSSALRIIRALRIEGGCNVQFALDPGSDTYYVIEVNPRVSRSSALASKATGYPIARVAAKLALGRTLDELPNQVTGRTRAAFEPSIDYCVTKVPRWPFDKFPDADRTIGTQMKSTGEVMAIERSFEASLNKAIRSLEQNQVALDELRGHPQLLDTPNDLRLFAVFQAMRDGLDVEAIHDRTGIDRWFLDRVLRLVRLEADLARGPLEATVLTRALQAALSHSQIAAASGQPVAEVEAQCRALGLTTVYKVVDTCAAEFAAATPYYYSTFEEENEAHHPEPGRSAIVFGSGPIRIGQGIEFDYCSVHSAWALQEAGLESVIVNSNPETVSTDFDTSTRLYFDPLDEHSALTVCRSESPLGTVHQFGGQTAIGLALGLDRRGIPVLGSSVDAIDLAEDRQRLNEVLDRLGITQPEGATTTSVEGAAAIADRIGYPVLVRPSYVLGGRAMEIVHTRSELERYMRSAVAAQARGPILVDKYMVGTEIEVDAVCDGTDVLIPGIMEHIERAGVHSGDSLAVYPAQTIDPATCELLVDHTRRIAAELKMVGLVNIQYVLSRRRLMVLEVNPRASRTVPFLSKVTGVPMVKLATRCMLGEKLHALGYGTGLLPARDLVAVKAPAFSMAKLLEVDTHLGPEMKSTGEVMGIDRTLPAALYKAFLASGLRVQLPGAVLCSIADADKRDALPLLARLAELGHRIYATAGTAAVLAEAGISATEVRKLGEGHPDVVDVILDGKVQLVINTISNVFTDPVAGKRLPMRDGYEIRRAAVERHIPCLTSLDTAQALLDSMAATEAGGTWNVLPMHEYLGEAAAVAVAAERC